MTFISINPKWSIIIDDKDCPSKPKARVIDTPSQSIKEIIRKKDNYYKIIDEMNLRKLAADLYMDWCKNVTYNVIKVFH